jgi:general nucleoside transport system permease protein
MGWGIVTSLLLAVIRLTPPIFMAGIGNMYCERVGILNLGAGGMMTIGALCAVLGSYFTGNPWVGLLCGVLGGGVAGAIHGLICAEFGGIQAIAGLGLNLFAGGLTTFLCVALFKERISPGAPNLGSTNIVKNIPYVGEFLSKLSPIIYIGVGIAILSYYIIYRTPLGLQIRAIGDDPKTVETSGINVWKIKFISVVICGLICGLAGAYMSIGILDRFVIGMIGARGMMAVIAVKMGRWNPMGILATALLLGTFDAIQLQIQLNSAINIPPELIQILPYIAGIIVLSLQSSDNSRPTAMEQPYLKNKYKI